MATYNTHQKEMLLSFLKSHPDTPFSIDALAEELERRFPDAPGKSTVYRLMSSLTENGTVKRFVNGNSRQFLYQIAGDEQCHHHLHMKCTDCGRLIHMDHKLSEKLLSNILGENDFSVEVDSTTLFGHCRDCKNKEKCYD